MKINTVLKSLMLSFLICGPQASDATLTNIFPMTLNNSVLLAHIHDTEVILRIPPDVLAKTCKVSIDSWDRAPEFAELASKLDIINANPNDTPIPLSVSTEEPQGNIELNLQYFNLSESTIEVLIRSKNGEAIADIVKQIFGNSSVEASLVGC